MDYPLVIFDMGGVLVDLESDLLVHQVAQLLNRSFDDVQAVIYDEALLLPFELGRINATAYYAGLNNRLQLPWSFEQFVQAWNGIFQENTGTTGILQRLRARHRLMVLSNTNELHLHHVRSTIPSLSVIEEWVASCDVGLRKPDPNFYFFALKQAGVLPRQAIYVDDRPEMVDAGCAIGLKGIRFHNSRQLDQDLQAVGLNL